MWVYQPALENYLKNQQKNAIVFFKVSMKFTQKQGQYLAFIYNYSKINGRPPAEADMQKYFRVTPPSVHQMVLTLEKNGLITRVPRQARSIRLLVPKQKIPRLE